MEPSFTYWQEQPLALGPGSGSNLQLSSTASSLQPSISRKRSFYSYSESPYYELDIPTVDIPDKRSRENSYDRSPISALTNSTPSADTPATYVHSDPPSPDYESPQTGGCLNSFGQKYPTSDNEPLSPKSYGPILLQKQNSHDFTSVEASPIATHAQLPTIISIGSSSVGNELRSFVEIDCDRDVTMEDIDLEWETEICFGMLQDSSVMSSKKLRKGVSNSLVLRYHKIIATTTFHLESGEYWGLLDPHTTAVISRLYDLQSIRFNSFLLTQKESGKGPQQDSSCGMPIYINIYGPEKISEDVGRILYENNIFLQHPLHKTPSIEYKNPHCLTIPKGMNLTTQSPTEMVDEVTTIFEVVEHTEFPQMDTTSIIKTKLLRYFILRIFSSRHFFRPSISLINESEPSKSHQKQALSFMIGRESLQVLSSRDLMIAESLCILPGAYGGILADQMGLGKSLSTLALVASSINQAEEFEESTDGAQQLLHAKTTLLIAPNSILSSWEEQINTHVEAGKLKVYRYHGPKRELDPQKLATYDIVMTTYSTVGHEFFPKGRAKSRRSPLKEIRWFRIVLDEAHIIRERSTQQSRAVCSLEAKHRWCLTGTPIQNKLDDLGSLFKFLRIRPYDSTNSFNSLIANPLKNADPQGLQRLRKLIGLFSIRRTKKILDLPQRTDQIEYVQFSTAERQVYEACTKDSAALIEAALSGKITGNSYFGILQSFLRLRLICDHGKELLPKEVNARIEEYIKLQAYSNSVNICADNSGLFGGINLAIREFCNCHIKQDNSRTEISASCLHVVCSKCLLRDQTTSVKDGNEGVPQLLCPICEETNDIKSSGDKLVPKASWIDSSNYSGPSTKVKALLGKLRDCEMESSDKPIKSIVFSCWTKMLDLVRCALFSEKMMFRRVDGSMNLQQREDAISCFRQNPLVNILLISIGTGSVGLNLTVASRVHLMEPQWNPMVEQQALGRVHRIGQTKEVITTRYIMKDSFEESVVNFQRRKLALVDLSLSGSATKTEALRERLKELRGLFK